MPFKTVKLDGHGSRHEDDLPDLKFKILHIGRFYLDLSILHLSYDWCGARSAPQRSLHGLSTKEHDIPAQENMWSTLWGPIGPHKSWGIGRFGHDPPGLS